MQNSPWLRHITPWVFIIVLIIQFFHYTEHLTQMYQHWWQGLPIKESGGILYFLNLEWNHLIFNGAYLLLLGFVFIAYIMLKKESTPLLPSFRVALFLIGTTILIQGYHVIEHTVRVGMYIKTGCEPCPGILGRVIDGIYLHFTFNTVVFFLPLIAVFILLRTKRLAAEEN